MIFVTDADGLTTYTSPDWTEVTGQPAIEATGHGWLASVHEADRQHLLEILTEATRLRTEFDVRYRLRRRRGSYIQVSAGAVPSFGPPGTTFLGFLGSITQVRHHGSEPNAVHGTVGRFRPPYWDDPTGTTLERVADHLLHAHALIDADGAKEVLPPIREALLRIGRALAHSSGDGAVSLH